jgi:signal transduction histidine kinase
MGSILYLLVQLFGNNNHAESLFINYHKSREFYTSYVRDALNDVSDIPFTWRALDHTPYHYYVSGGTIKYADTDHDDREFYASNDKAFFYLEDGEWRAGKNSYDKLDVYNMLSDYYVIYISFPKNFLEEKQRIWESYRENLMPKAIILLIFATVEFITLVSLCIVDWKGTSKSAEQEGMEKAYSEVLLLPFLLGLGAATYFLPYTFHNDISLGMMIDYLGMDYLELVSSENASLAIFVGVIGTLAAALLLGLLLAMLRKCKKKCFIRDSIIYRTGNRIIKLLAELLRYIFYHDVFGQVSFTKRLYYRQLIFLIITLINAAVIVIIMPYRIWWFSAPLAIELFAMIWFFKGNKWLLNNINEEIKVRMEEQIKSERMKVALVTNVSHDLKTPLTSIISFIDLLSKEEELSETSRDYVRILQEKSERLKNIVNDLFELAKSTSGEAVVVYENLDLTKLIRQTLADMEDVIIASQLPIKLVLPDYPVIIYADGKKLYRVFQNVIDNAIKYSLRGTRIIIEMSLLEEQVVVWIKNIAGYEMNFTEQEILQRFFRGDQSRSTEGSGLGLSIAESFTKVCGGELSIEIDGDMFKTAIRFPRVKKSVELTESSSVKKTDNMA